MAAREARSTSMTQDTASRPKRRKSGKSTADFKHSREADEEHPWREMQVSIPNSDASTTASPSDDRKLRALEAKQRAAFEELSSIEQIRLRNIATHRALFKVLGLDTAVSRVGAAGRLR
jgi:hypothetical protein